MAIRVGINGFGRIGRQVCGLCVNVIPVKSISSPSTILATWKQ